MKHYHIMNSHNYKCSCGKEFKSLPEIWSHLDNFRVIETTDGVTKCPDCKGASYLPKLKGCENIGHQQHIMMWDELTAGQTLDTRHMGTAGAAIEYESHQKTLLLLRRARDIMLTSNDHYLIGFVALLNDIKKQCPALDEIEVEE